MSRRIDYQCANKPVDSVLLDLSAVTHLNITCNPDWFAHFPLVHLNAKQETLGNILGQLLKNSAFQYSVSNPTTISITRKPKHTLSGFVRNAAGDENLLDASVTCYQADNRRPVAYLHINTYGFFSVTLEEKTYLLVVRRVGFVTHEEVVTLTADRQIKVKLEPNPALAPVDVNGGPKESFHRPRYPDGGIQLNLEAMRSTPHVGDPDVIREISAFPGVQTGVDGIGGVHIRGGNADQNLFLLDDVPIYNPGHALGMFSIYNPSMLSSARLWKGDFPARYGARASSVIDVRTRDGNNERHVRRLSIGLFEASGMLEGPIVQDKASYVVAFRHTYFQPWVKRFSGRPNVLNITSNQLNYRFFDGNGKLNWTINEHNRVYLSLYNGGDRFFTPFTLTSRASNGTFTDQYTLGSDWGNTVAAARWNYIPASQRMFLNTTLRFSRFYYQSQLGRTTDFLSDAGRLSRVNDYRQFYQTLIRDISIKSDLTFYQSKSLTLRSGVSITHHHFRPGAISLNFQLPGQSQTVVDSLSSLLLKTDSRTALENELYTEGEWQIDTSWRLGAGVNLAAFTIGAANYLNLLPRMRLQHDGRHGWSQWVSQSWMAQNLHQIGSFNLSLPFELWVPSTEKVRPEKVWQLSLGNSWQYRGWVFQLEGYYKKLNRAMVLRTSNDALVTGGAEDASGWEDRIANGQGQSRGLEVLVAKKFRRISGNVAYTWSKTTRQFDDINQGREFAFRFDRRHDVKVSGQYRLRSWLDLNGSWAYSTGLPITLTGVQYTHLSPESEVPAREVYVYSDVNDFRLPQYHRLDLSANFTFGNPRVLQHFIQAGVYNAYNRANPIYLTVEASGGGKARAKQYTMLPVVPILRYEAKF